MRQCLISATLFIVKQQIMRQTMRGCRIICRIGTSLFETVVSSVVVVTVVVVSDSVVVVVASLVVTSGAEEQPLNACWICAGNG